MPTKTWQDALKVFEEQEEYCAEHNVPIFMPDDGYCPKCRSNLAEMISLYEARRKYFTGCPLCKATWCD